MSQAEEAPLSHGTNFEALRKRAEQVLALEPNETPTLPTTDVQHLIHELHVFQTELELQNEELHRSQIELAETRNHYSDLFEEAPIGYLSLDRQGKIRSANRHAEEIFGKPRHELIEQPAARFFSAESQLVLSRHLEALFHDGQKRRCEVTCYRDEQLRHLMLKSILTQWEGEPRCHTAVVDMTERYCIEHELQELNLNLERRVTEQTQRMRLLAEAVSHLGEGVIITEGTLEWPGPEIVFVNKALCRITGYQKEQILGNTLLFLHGEGSYRKLLAKLEQSVKEGCPCEMELVSLRQDGTPYHSDLFITPLLNEQGIRTHFVGILRDISARKQAEQERREREEWLRAILDGASDAIIIVDHRGEIVRVNPASQKLFGYPLPELLEIPLTQLIPVAGRGEDEGGDRDSSRPSLHFLGKTRELMGRRSDGTRFPIEVSGNQVDHLPFFTCIVRDISERKAAAEALLESQQRFDLAIRGSADGIWDWTDVGEDACWWSPRFFELLGYQPGEIPPSHRTLRRLLHPEDRQRIAAALNAHLMDSVRFDVEYRLQTKSGQYRWFRARAHVLRNENGQAQRMTGCLEDIENRKQIEESLRREHELSDSIVETCPAIVMVLDPQGKVLRFNRFAEKITGWDASEVVGQNWLELSLRTEDQTLIAELFQQAVHGEQTAGYVGKLLSKDGRELDIEWYDAPLSGPSGEFVGLVCIGQDITERRALEQEVLEVAAEEQHRIGNDLHDGVCQQLTGLGMLAEGLADLLRDESAAKATASAETAAEGSAGGRPPRDLFAVARQLSEGLGRATAHTRSLSHGLIPVDVDAEGLRASLVELARSIEQLHQVDCHFESLKGLQVRDNYVANHLYRIAQEAVANALRHGNPRTIAVSLREQDGHVVLRIADDGVGIHAHDSWHDGMGLRIMQYRANMIGAALTVQSLPGAGTTIECRCIKRRTGDPSPSKS